MPADLPSLPPAPGPGPRDRALELLRRIIAEGGIAPGAELPSSRELGRSFGIPHATVFRALRVLEEQGVVERTAWAGYRVVGVDGLAADLAHGSIAPGALAGTVVVLMLGEVLLRERQSGWSDRMVLGAIEQLVETGVRSLPVHVRRLRAGDLDRLIQGRPAGVVLPEADHAWDETLPVIARLHAAGIPVVIGGEHAHLPDVDGVLPDHAAGAGLLVDWLHAQGRRHPVQLLPALPQVLWPEERRRGYQAAAARLGLPVHPRVVFTGLLKDDPRHDHAWEVNRRYAAGVLVSLFREAPATDAILAVTDPDVLVLAAALRDLGREPQRDVLLVGYDNYLDQGVWELAYETARPAATVDKDNLAMGAAMVSLLQRRIAGGLPPAAQRLRHPPRLVVAGG